MCNGLVLPCLFQKTRSYRREMNCAFGYHIGGSCGHSPHFGEFGQRFEGLRGSVEIHEDRIARGHPSFDEPLLAPVLHFVKLTKSVDLPRWDWLLTSNAPCLLVIAAGNTFFQ